MGNYRLEKHVAALNQILVENGRDSSERAASLVLDGIALPNLQQLLQALFAKTQDLIRPTLVRLACEAVGGIPETVMWASVFMVLEGYYLGLLDDLVDQSTTKGFAPTFVGRFGVERALIVSGLLSAKATYALSKMAGAIAPEQYAAVHEAFHTCILTGAEAEIENAHLKRRGIIDPVSHYRVLEKQAADIEACLVIGAIGGGGSPAEVRDLGHYGRVLGTLIRIREDVNVALNRTVELAEKLRQQAYPYPFICAMAKSKQVEDWLRTVGTQEKIEAVDVERGVSILFETGVTTDLGKLGEALVERAMAHLEKIGETEAVRGLETVVRAQAALLFSDLTLEGGSR